MSILQEYESIKKSLGEEVCRGIDKYLTQFPKVLLSDLFYKKECWEEFEKWGEVNGVSLAKKEALLLNAADLNLIFNKAPLTDIYIIYQLSDSDSARDKRFMPFSPNRAVLAGEYTQVYQAELTDKMTLDSIFQKFNIDIPEDYKGHSLSVSDIIVLKKDGTENAYYVDSFGFKKLPHFIEDLHNVQSEELDEEIEP